MKLWQRALPCSLSAAGEICEHVLSSRGSVCSLLTQGVINGCVDDNNSSHVYRVNYSYLTSVSCNKTLVQTNAHSLCTHDNQLKDLVLISREFVCSLTVWAPGCRVNGLSEGLSSLARVQLSCCLDSVMCNATMGVLSGSCVWALRVHYSLESLWDAQTSLYDL